MTVVTYSSPYIPAEWVAAHGLRPSLIFPGPRSVSAGTREGVCPFAQAYADEVARHGAAGAALFVTGCDQMRRAAEIAARGAGVAVFVFNLPGTWETPTALALYAAELRRLGRFLVALGGRHPSEDDLVTAMVRHDAARAAMRAARERLPPRAYAEALAAFRRGGECAVSMPDPAPAGRRRGTPVGLVGGPLPAEEFRLYDAVEQFGGRVAFDGTESGERTFPRPFDRERMGADAVGELADAYLRGIPGIRQRPNRPFYEWLGRELRRSGARGIIVRQYVWCDLWRAEVPRVAEESGLPVLHLDVEGGERCWKRTETRLQAFLEVLSAEVHHPT